MPNGPSFMPPAFLILIDAPLLSASLSRCTDWLVGGCEAVLLIDDTALPKKGNHSVGVAAQYASSLGKNGNCQTLVSLTLAREEVPVPCACSFRSAGRAIGRDWCERVFRSNIAQHGPRLRSPRRKSIA